MSLDMESYPLNLAHQQHRRADAHLMNNKYDEAVKCHQNAVELLEDAIKTTSSSAAIESMSFQQTYHLKQKDLIESKKQQHFRVKKVVEHIKQGKDSCNVEGNECMKLQLALCKKVKDTDKLLQEFSNRKAAVKSINEDVVNSQNIVIDEVHTNMKHMQPLLEKLLYQIELLKDENASLRDRVNYLEDERVKYLNLPSSYGDLGTQHYFMTNTSHNISAALGNMSFNDHIGLNNDYLKKL